MTAPALALAYQLGEQRLAAPRLNVETATEEDVRCISELLNAIDTLDQDKATAAILDRIREDDVPVHVAADIDQILTEAADLIHDVAYAVVPADNPRQGPPITYQYPTEGDARAIAASMPGARVARVTTVVTYLPGSEDQS